MPAQPRGATRGWGELRSGTALLHQTGGRIFTYELPGCLHFCTADLQPERRNEAHYRATKDPEMPDLPDCGFTGQPEEQAGLRSLPVTQFLRSVHLLVCQGKVEASLHLWELLFQKENKLQVRPWLASVLDMLDLDYDDMGSKWKKMEENPRT